MLQIDDRQFKFDIQKFAAKIGIDLATVRRRIAFDLYRRITLRTPVKSGRARLSWMMSDGQPNPAVAPEIPKGTPPPKARPPSAFPLTNNPYAVTYIVNNLPYIIKLEFGSSQQAPAGMVRVSLAEVVAELKATQERLT